jgi:hypothetical protein
MRPECRNERSESPPSGDGPQAMLLLACPWFEAPYGGNARPRGTERFFVMAFTETYHCDVCGNPRGDAEDWWLALTEPASLIPSAPEQPMLRLTAWNVLLSHAAKVRHLCGARCAQTLMDRWMRGE